MNKSIWFLMILATFSVGAQSNRMLVEQLEKLENLSPEVECAPEKLLYTPNEAIKDINSSKLTFMGRSIFPGSGQNYTCVYKSDRAYILYNNCMANKKESAATDIEVISFEGDITSFYILNAVSEIPVSSRVRSQYDMSWRVSTRSSPPPGKLNIEQIKAYKEKSNNVGGGCFIGRTFKAQDMDSKVQCIGQVQAPEWSIAAESFWKDPSEDWYKTKKHLRTVIKETTF